MDSEEIGGSTPILDIRLGRGSTRETECSEIGNLPMFRAYEEEVSGSVECSNDHEKVRRSGENSR